MWLALEPNSVRRMWAHPRALFCDHRLLPFSCPGPGSPRSLLPNGRPGLARSSSCFSQPPRVPAFLPLCPPPTPRRSVMLRLPRTALPCRTLGSTRRCVKNNLRIIPTNTYRLRRCLLRPRVLCLSVTLGRTRSHRSQHSILAFPPVRSSASSIWCLRPTPCPVGHRPLLCL